MGLLQKLFSKPLSKQEVGEYLAKVGKYQIGVPFTAVIAENFVNEKGKRVAAEGKKILTRHKLLFQGCQTNQDIMSRLNAICDRWPNVSDAEHALLSDLVKVHRSIQ